MFASSRAASTSSRMQNGTGLTLSIANSSATPVSARSPPDSIAQPLEALAGRSHHDLDAAGRLPVLAIAELQGGRAAGEQEPAEVVESLADGREGGVEARR